ncbi:unnamed protein product, partial [Rotaria sp. Silwood2]
VSRKENIFSGYNKSLDLGGLTAVIWTDFIQTVIMVISAFILMIIIGGMQQIRNLFPYAVAHTTLHNTTECGVPNQN